METIDWIIVASFVMPLFLSGLMLWFFIRYQRKKHQYELDKKDALLKHQALLLEKQQAVEKERTRIASEMHDDLGSGLTTIRYLSERALKRAENSEEVAQIERIALQSNQLVTNMSEIIWAMNSRFDTLGNLAAYIRRYASEYLEEHEMPFAFSMNLEDEKHVLTGEKRRNIFLIVKEALHNSVKYSGASAIKVEVTSNDLLQISITESDAVGFDAAEMADKGNGLFNMNKRVKDVGGDLQFVKSNDSMQITLTLPLEKETA